MRPLNVFRETGAVMGLRFRNVLMRPLLPAIMVTGFLSVVLVMVSMLSIGRGMNRTYANTGGAGVAMALSDGALVESQSSLSGSDVQALESEPGVVKGTAGPLASPELVTTIELPKQGSGVTSDVVLRGVTEGGYRLHPQVHMITGRMYKSGIHQIIIGRQAAREYRGLRVGAVVHTDGVDWTVTGVFASNGNIHESEIWTDLPGLQNAQHEANRYSAVYLQVATPRDYALFASAVRKDPRLAVQVQTEKGYYANIASGVADVFLSVSLALATLMALGAVVGAINLMYVHLASRIGDIATLRAVGFRRLSVFCAVLCEGLSFGLTGGVIGGLIAYAAFDGAQAGTIFFGGATQVDFQLSVTAGQLVGGLVFALTMGFIGGLFPAIRAARLPVAKALRET